MNLLTPNQECNHVDPRSGFWASHGVFRRIGNGDYYRAASFWERALFLTWVRARWLNGPRWGLVMFFTEENSARLMCVRFRFRIMAVITRWLLSSRGEWFRLEIYDHLIGRLESETGERASP